MRHIILMTLFVSTGCLTMQAPERFMVTDRGGESLKAITPEESKLWVRSFNDDNEGGLAFWRDALAEDLKKNRGYVILSEADTKDANGNAGKELVFETSVNGRPVRELLALFVYDGMFGDTIRVVEYVAEKDQFEKEVAGVRASIGTMKP